MLERRGRRAGKLWLVSSREPELVKMSVFAERAGLPVPTIKHYLREGLLPEPVRTSRNMAYYDVALIPRVQIIKALQKRFFLPLKIIREVLEEVGDDVAVEDIAVRLAIQRALSADRADERRTRSELLASGMPEETLDWFIGLGIVSAERAESGEQSFGGDDLSLLRTLKEARTAGLSPEMLPPSILQDYVDALQNLVKAELSMFRAGVLPRAGDDVAELSERATQLSERLVVLLRRKLLLPTLRRLFLGEAARRG